MDYIILANKRTHTIFINSYIPDGDMGGEESENLFGKQIKTTQRLCRHTPSERGRGDNACGERKNTLTCDRDIPSEAQRSGGGGRKGCQILEEVITLKLQQVVSPVPQYERPHIHYPNHPLLRPPPMSRGGGPGGGRGQHDRANESSLKENILLDLTFFFFKSSYTTYIYTYIHTYIHTYIGLVYLLP